MSALDPLDRIVAALHKAALDDAHWPAVAALVDQACATRGNALVVGSGQAQADARIFYARLCCGGEHLAERQRWYFDTYFPHDERIPRLTQLPDSRVVPMPEMYTPQELKASPAYNEALPRGGYQNGLNVRLDGPDDSHIVWTLADSTEPGGWPSDRIELVEHLLPHLRQFVRVRQALSAAEGLGTSLVGLLDNSRIGIIHLDRRGRVAAANATAGHILRRGDGLFDRDGTLHAHWPKDHDRLQRLLQRALPGLRGVTPAAGSMTIGRAAGLARLGLHVSPVGDTQTDYGARRVAALVLVVDPASRPAIDPDRVSATLGLTPAEGRAAALLAEGRPVRDIAALTGYRDTYVRWLLKQAYRKHGVSGQAALTRLVLAADALPRD